MTADRGFNAVDRVTEQHAERFVLAFFKKQHNTLAMQEAFDDAGVMTSECTCLNECVHIMVLMAMETKMEKLIEARIAPALRAAFIEAAEAVLHPQPKPATPRATGGAHA